MSKTASTKTHWCIVSADDHGPDWSPNAAPEGQRAPAQYCSLVESATPLQTAIARAARLTSINHVMVTALEEYRQYWEPALWPIRPENRFVGDSRAASLLTGAAALLAIAKVSPSSVVTILPARCHVTRGYILETTIDQARFVLPSISEGVITLGMMDMEEAFDEDYLVASRAPVGGGYLVQGFARRPTPWIARHLKRQGALVASGIMVGYAGAFAAHISKHWPGLTRKLDHLVEGAKVAETECEIQRRLQDGVPKAVLSSLRWNPPSFPQRAFRVRGCGWTGLKTARAVEAISTHFSTDDRGISEESCNV